jgi:hypothetical protein
LATPVWSTLKMHSNIKANLPTSLSTLSRGVIGASGDLPVRPSALSLAIAGALALGLNASAHAQTFPAEIKLADLDGSNGFVLTGEAAGDQSGISVSAAGDINGDGIDDLIIGAWYASPNGNSDAGRSYVVFGSESGLPHPFDLSSINGLNGFVIDGEPGDYSGWSVAAAGDINGDGIDDLIIGARYADPDGKVDAGRSFVVFGSATGLPNPFDLSTLDGTNGFVIIGEAAYDHSGISVSSAGDINGDGIDDLIIGAFLANPNGNSNAGRSYVVFGSAAGFPGSIDLSTLDGSNGFVINGAAAGEMSGVSVSAAGDINGDGIDDLIIGAYRADPNGKDNAGRSYVVFGSTSGFPSSFDLSSINGLNGFMINGEAAGDRLGYSVSAAGDINGDGIDDLIIGAINASPNGVFRAGRSYVIFGSDSGLPNPFDLSTLDGTNGFVINGQATYDSSGWSVSAAGDINGDGIGDLIIGALNADPDGNINAGRSYVVFGSATGLPHPFNLSTLDGTNGFVINGEAAGDFSGLSVSAAGDINGNGIDDLIIGAPFANPNGNSNAGRSYVVFGRRDGLFTDRFEDKSP